MSSVTGCRTATEWRLLRRPPIRRGRRCPPASLKSAPGSGECVGQSGLGNAPDQFRQRVQSFGIGPTGADKAMHTMVRMLEVPECRERLRRATNRRVSRTANRRRAGSRPANLPVTERSLVDRGKGCFWNDGCGASATDAGARLPRHWAHVATPAGGILLKSRRPFQGVAGGPGFEPRLPESESGVLPLNYPPAGTRRPHRRQGAWTTTSSRGPQPPPPSKALARHPTLQDDVD